MVLTELPFIGRQKELEILRTNLAQAIEEQGSCVFLFGLPGMGKSRLVNQYCTELTDSEHTIIKLTVGERPMSEMHMFVAIIREYVRTAKTIKLVPKVIDDIMYAACHKLIPELDAFFPYEPAAPKMKLTAAEMIFRFLHNLTIFNPVILIIEDMHNATLETRKLLEYILGNTRTLPVLCVLTSRPSPEVEHWYENVRSLAPSENLEIKGLSVDEVVSLNTVFFQNQLPVSFFSWLTSKTHGNPIFVRGILRFLLEKGIVYLDTHKNTWCVYEPFEKISMPGDFSQTVATQADLLSPRAKKFLEFASLTDTDISPQLIGFRFTNEEIAELLKTGMVIEKDKTLRFSHPLYRDAVYAMLSNRKKKELHIQLGDRLIKNGDEEHGLIQYTKAGRHNQRIVNRLIKICQKYMSEGDNAQALHCCERVFRIISTQKKNFSSRVLRWVREYAVFLTNVGRSEDALHICDVVLGLIKTRQIKLTVAERAVLYSTYVSVLYHAGKYKEVIKHASDVLKMITRASIRNKKNLWFTVSLRKAYALKYLGQINDALQLARSMEKKYPSSQSPYEQYRIYSLLGAIQNVQGKYSKAAVYREQALAFAEKTGNENAIATAQGNLGISLVPVGEFKRAEELFLKHQTHQLLRGWQREISIAHLNFGNSYYCQGKFRDAIDEIMKGMIICERIGSHKDLAWFHINCGASMIFLGNFKLAEHYLIRAMDWTQRYGLKGACDEAMYFRGLLYGLTGNTSALADIISSFDRPNEKKCRFPILYGFHMLLTNKQKQGRKALHDGLAAYEAEQLEPGYCRTAYICAKVLEKARLKHTPLNPMIAKADEIAQRLNMNGWSDWFYKAHAQADAEPLRVYTLGTMRIELPRKGVVRQQDWEGHKTRQLFTVLVRSFLDNRALSRDEIGLLLWPELTKKQVVNNFHVCLTQLKGIIGKTHVERQRSNYRLAGVWIDALHFRNLVRKAEALLSAGKVHAAERKFNRALELYTGDFFKDFYGAWLDETRAKLSSLYRKALFLCGDIYIRKMKTYEAEELGRKILALDPYDEEGHRFLMHCYMKSGEKAKALAQYKRCQEIFKKGLNCEPSHETRKLYREIKQR